MDIGFGITTKIYQVSKFTGMEQALVIGQIKGNFLCLRSYLVTYASHSRVSQSGICPVLISGLESLHVCRLPTLAKKVVRKPKVSFTIPALTQSAKEADWFKECLRYRNNFLTLKEFFKPSPYHFIHRTSTVNPCSR